MRDPPSPLRTPARNLHSITGDLSHFLPLHYFLLHSFLSLSQSMVGPFSVILFPLLVPVPLPFPLILFLLSCSFLPVISLFPFSCYSVSFLLSLSSLSSASCSFSLSSHVVPLVLFLSSSYNIVPSVSCLFCFFPCPLLVLLHVPFPFPFILFLLSCASLPLPVALFPLSCYSFLVLS